MTDLTTSVQEYLSDAGYEIHSKVGPFAFVAQNPSILVFVVEANTDLEQSVRSTTNYLAAPFRRKIFGPKTLEMYCIFIADHTVPVATIERCERDLRVCRKVVVAQSRNIDTRLSFLKPLEDILAAAPNANELFWKELAKRLSEDEASFVRTLLYTPDLLEALKEIPIDL